MFRKTLVTLAAALVLPAAALATGTVGPFHNTVHADASLTLKGGAVRAWSWDRGKITALSSDSISIVRRDKVAVTFAIDEHTQVRNDGASYTLADLKEGQIASVFSQDGKALLIRRIRGDGAPSGGEQTPLMDGPFKLAVTGTIDALQKDGSSMRIEYDRAQIEAKDASSLTLKRADGVELTLSYDASTVVREQGEPSSVDMLEVGERAMFFSQDGKALLIRCVSAPKAQSPAPAAAPAPSK